MTQTTVRLDGGDEVRRGLLEILHALVGQDHADAHAAGQLQHVFEIGGYHPLELVNDEKDRMPALRLCGGSQEQ